MTDQRNSSSGPAVNPWMRPMHSQQLLRRDQPRQAPEPAGPYTPNEPDHNEAIYAARAAAARQQAAARQAAGAEPPSVAQMAVEQAAQQAHAARQTLPPLRENDAAVPYPAQPAAVLYQQATGVQQPVQPAVQKPARPTQPHRLPMDAYLTVEPANEAAAPSSRLLDDGALADAMLAEETLLSTSPRRRRMVMRQERAAAEWPDSAPAEAVQPMDAIPDMVQMPPLPQDDQESSAESSTVPVREEAPALEETQPMDAIPDMPELPPLVLLPQDDPEPETDAPAAPASEEALVPEESQAAPETTQEAAPETADPQPDPQPEVPLNPSSLPSDFFDMPLENPLKQYDWYNGDVLEEDDDPEEDCMESSSMPTPAPVSTVDIPKVRQGKRLLTVLLTLMLLVAAAAFLWLSGYGEKLYHGAGRLVEHLQNPTVATGPMSVAPESAALPATLTITLTTDASISDLRLLDDSHQPLPVAFIAEAQGDQTLWTGTLTMETAYDGFLHTLLLCKDGQWRTGREKVHVTLN